MSFFKTIGNAIYREYDRRVKRASLITEYGAQHHAHDDHAEDVSDDAHAKDTVGAGEYAEDPAEDAEQAEIANVPRGTPVPDHKP